MVADETISRGAEGPRARSLRSTNVVYFTYCYDGFARIESYSVGLRSELLVGDVLSFEVIDRKERLYGIF
jgi:hypothetical protein